MIALQVLNGIRPFLSVSGGSIEIFELGADDPKVVLKMIGPPLKSMAATWQETLDGERILETWKAYEIWLEVWLFDLFDLFCICGIRTLPPK